MGNDLERLQPDDGFDNPLTDSEMIFFNAVLAGEAPAASFSKAYDTQGWAPGRVYRLAMRLRNSPKIVAALAAAKEAGAGSGIVTREAHLRELEGLRDRAKADNNLAVAIRAEELRGKVAGLYVERVEHVATIDPVAVLRKMAAIKSMEPIARALAQQHGIPWAQVEGKVITLRAEPAPGVLPGADTVDTE